MDRILRMKFENFKTKYSSRYSKEAWEYIEENFFSMIHSKETPDILMQIYSELGINPSAAVFYKKHLKLLKSIFPLDGNIVEVASGRIPAFANMLAKEQGKLGKGTVTIYEPLLVELEPKYPNMTIHNEYFREDTDIAFADLVVAIMPCDVTETILENAIKSGKPFYVAMCGCVHSPWASMYSFGFGTSPEIYQQQVMAKAESLIEEYGGEELQVTKLKNSPIDYPILYRKKLVKN
jgi:hypothetical protein